MLEKISVNNFALLRDTEIEIRSGFTAVTGETGSGKSLLVGSISFLAGGKVSPGVVRDDAKKAVVEGEFRLDDCSERLIARRELYTDGRSRAFIDDSPVTLKKYSERVSSLIDITAQRSFSHLLDTSHHLYLLDSYAGLLNEREALSDYFRQNNRLQTQIKQTKEKIAEFERRSELLQFQLSEIDAIDPHEGEDEELLAEIRKLEHFEEIIDASRSVDDILTDSENSVESQLSSVDLNLSQLRKWDETLGDLTDDFNTARITLREVALQVRNRYKDFDFEPDQLETFRERQLKIAGLIRKYGGSMTAMLEHRDKLKEELKGGNDFKQKIDALKREATELLDRWRKLVKQVSNKRIDAANKLENAVIKGMAKLGVKQCVFRVEFTRKEDEIGVYEEDDNRYAISEFGLEMVQFLLSANPGLDPKPLVQVASGGELSRLLLTLKSLVPTGNDDATVIFDEIDVGVSGRIAGLIGEKLYELGNGRQLIAVTHLPQIASMANHHLRVRKIEQDGVTVSGIMELESEERISEVASLISSGDISGEALAQAQNLIKEARKKVNNG